MAHSEPPLEETALQRIVLAPNFRRFPRMEWTMQQRVHSKVIERKTLIGSATGATIVIADPTVSRLHAELEPRDDGLWVRDLGSRNGTFLEGLRVTGARIPQAGRLRLGETELTIDYTTEAPRPIVMSPNDSFGPLIGGSPAMRELFAVLAQVSPQATSVLIQGETGTGKELVARAIHESSDRADKPFVVVDCAALPENLLDAELFGHTKGAFTGAIGSRIGAIEAAEGGTVFLDEIGELPISVQPKLLRVLESRTVRRIGETHQRHVDVRFISATHRDLVTMVSASEFREDLYFRLAVIPITVPPLRDRKDDIERLFNAFWNASGAEGRVSLDLMRELSTRPWRGNVRELRNFVDRARALGASGALALSATRAESPSPPPAQALHVAPEPPNADLYEHSFKEFRERWIDQGEREYVRRLLAKHQRNVSAAATAAGVDRTYVYRLIRKHDL